MSSRALLLVIVLLAVGAGAYYVSNLAAENAELRQQMARVRGGGAPPPAADKPAAAPGAAPTGEPRVLSEGQKAAILDILKEEAGEKKVWFRVDPNDPEASAYQKSIEEVFKAAGWETSRLGNDGLMFKPGIYLLVGEEEWPGYAETANRALEAAGITVTAARGYRAYYEEMTKTKPGWRGAKFSEGQTYVVLVGRKPEA
jgi:hypothetical protein